MRTCQAGAPRCIRPFASSTSSFTMLYERLVFVWQPFDLIATTEKCGSRSASVCLIVTNMKPQESGVVANFLFLFFPFSPLEDVQASVPPQARVVIGMKNFLALLNSVLITWISRPLVIPTPTRPFCFQDSVGSRNPQQKGRASYHCLLHIQPLCTNSRRKAGDVGMALCTPLFNPHGTRSTTD